MGSNNIKYLLYCFLLYNLIAFSNDYFVVYFEGKHGGDFTLDKPLEYLSQRSLERRGREGVLVDSTDLPVNDKNIEELKQRGIDVIYTSKWLNAALVLTEESVLKDLNQTYIKTYEKLARKEIVSQKDEIESVFSDQDTTVFNSSIYGNSFTQISMLNIDSLHREGYSGKGILIGVLDEGFFKVSTLTAFDRLKAQILDSYNFVDVKKDVFDIGNHGTHVLSIMAAWLPNKLIGPAYGASFCLYHTENSKIEMPIEEFYYLLAAERADSIGVDILSSSLGYRDFDDPSFDHNYPDLDGNHTIASVAAKMLARKGVIVVTSAGNTGNGAFKTVGTPADSDSILTVGSVNSKFQKSGFSSIGPTVDGRIKPDVCAMGEGVYVVNIDSDGNTITTQGTSFSAPLIAGFVALIKEKYPSWKSQEIIKFVKESSSNASSPDSQIGFGVPYYGIRSTNVDSVKDEIYIFESADMMYWHFDSNLINKMVDIEIYDIKGSLIFSYSMKVQSSMEKINTIGINPGYYICKIKSVGELITKMFLKK